MSDKRTYCGVKRVKCFTPFKPKDTVISSVEDGKLLGDRILEAALYGADLGVSVSVSYDDNVVDDSTTHDVDILASPNHDFFDIAEATGKMIEGSIPARNEDNE